MLRWIASLIMLFSIAFAQSKDYKSLIYERIYHDRTGVDSTKQISPSALNPLILGKIESKKPTGDIQKLRYVIYYFERKDLKENDDLKIMPLAVAQTWQTDIENSEEDTAKVQFGGQVGDYNQSRTSRRTGSTLNKYTKSKKDHLSFILSFENILNDGKLYQELIEEIKKNRSAKSNNSARNEKTKVSDYSTNLDYLDYLRVNDHFAYPDFIGSYSQIDTLYDKLDRSYYETLQSNLENDLNKMAQDEKKLEGNNNLGSKPDTTGYALKRLMIENELLKVDTLKNQFHVFQSSRINKIMLDLSFSRIALSFPFTFIQKNSVDTIAYPSFGFEVNAEEEVMNMLPWENRSLNYSARLLIPVGKLGYDDKTNRINVNSAFLDTRFILRRAIDWTFDFNKDAEAAKVNTTNAIGAKIMFTKISKQMPYISLFFVAGKRKFDEPSIKFYDGDTYHAYYNFLEFESLMSFFFNSDENDMHRFKLDLGASLFDVHKATFNKETNKVLEWERIYWTINPVFKLSYYFDYTVNSRRNPFLGIETKFMMSRLTTQLWLKLAEFRPDSELRFQAMYISPPFARESEEWENNGGYSLQLRFKHTF